MGLQPPESGVRIQVAEQGRPRTVFIPAQTFTRYIKTIRAVDPNFPGDGQQVFTGIPLSELIGLAKGDKTRGMTVIGADQYVGYLPPEWVGIGILAWEADQNPVSGLNGGPYKLIFPESEKVPFSCYTWYVAGMIQDGLAPPGIGVSVSGKSGGSQPQSFTHKDLVSMAVPLDTDLVSIALGCRNGLALDPSFKKILAVPLASLIPNEDKKIASLVLTPFVGRELSLPPEVLSYRVYVIVEIDGQPVHPALGGPYSVIFPVEHHGELAGKVPESGAFFFLETIEIK